MIRGIRDDQSSYFKRKDQMRFLLAASFSMALLALISIIGCLSVWLIVWTRVIYGKGYNFQL